MDMTTLAMAKSKVVDLDKFTVKDGSVFAGATLSFNLLYLCQRSVDNGGVVQEVELILNDETFNKECASKSDVILKVTADIGTKLVDVYFPATVSVMRESKAAANVHAYAVLYIDGMISVDACFVFSTYNKFKLYVKATPFA